MPSPAIDSRLLVKMLKRCSYFVSRVRLALTFLVLIALSVVSQLHFITHQKTAGSTLTTAQLAAVHGRDVPECIQYFEDHEQPSWDCWSPYSGINNDCDWKLCTTNPGPAGCGNGRHWSGLYKATWYAISETSQTTGWRLKTSPCIGMIECQSEGFDPDSTCFASVLVEHFLDPSPRVTNLGCDTPLPGTNPTGCSTCRAGMPLPYHPDNQNWSWYESVPCQL